MQKFLIDTINSRYIKALLNESYIPKYKCVSVGDTIVESTWDGIRQIWNPDIRYIYRNNIIRCTKTGEIGNGAKYEVVSSYDKYLVNLQVNQNYLSKETYYDSETHIALGDLLRYYKSQTGINLLPLYNCFSNKFVSSFSLTRDGISGVPSSSVKIIEVPIKFNTDYTIAIDCPSQVLVAPVFLNNEDFLFVGDANVTVNYYKNHPIDFFSELAFLSPKTYRVDNDDAYFEAYENYLTLLIQVPNECNSSVVILEGDYTNVSCRKVMNNETIPEENYYGLGSLDVNEQNRIFLSDLSLLRMNDRVSYAFSDRLILYLLSSAITSDEDIYNNIRRVQEDIDAEDYYQIIPDVWDDRLRKVLFDTYMENKYTKKEDVLGYVDNEMEKFLLKRRSSK